jgi:Bacterial Ig domain
MTQFLKRGVLGAAAAIGLLAGCAADQTTGGVVSAGIAPVVDVIALNGTSGQIDVSQPVQVQVTASGERAIRRVTIDVLAGTRRLGGMDTVLATPAANVSLSSSIALVAVNAGEQVELRAVARDMRNLVGGDTTRVTVVASSTGGGTDTTGTGGGSTGPNAPPRVRIESPSDTAVIYAGRTIPIRVTAIDTNGVLRVDFTVKGAGFTDLSYTFRAATAPAPDSVTRQQIIDIPTTAVLDSVITVTATAIDGLSASSAPVVKRFTVRVQPADSTAPLVTQRVGGRLEDGSTIVVRAVDASPIRKLGYRLLDSIGNIIATDSVYRAAGSRRTLDSAIFAVRFPTSARGQLASVISFAEDTVANVQRVNRGWSVPDNGVLPATTAADAARSFAMLVYGHTLPLPTGSVGADIAVDTAQGRQVVYVSNITRNRLDVFNYSTLQSSGTVLVGSEPWGMHLDAARGDLLVGNSGGTNISRVDLASRQEVGRFNTPNTRAWQVKEVVADNGKVTITAEEFNYSDRPQYVARSASGFVYYSTKPTATATPGTIRRFVPGSERNLQQLWQYGDRAEPGEYGIIDADEVVIIKGLGATKSDEIIIYDHRATDTGPMTISTRDSNTVRGVAALRALGGDAVASDVDVASLALTDTTYAAVGGDQRWIGFGEGHKSPAGRVMLFSDVLQPGNAVTATPGVSVLDLTDNASDQVFGLAINRNSSTVAVQGGDAFYAGIDDGDFRYQLRLQGRYVTPGTGSGVAYHPLNDGTQSTAAPVNRATFVAGSDPVIDIVDSYFYRLRGQLPIRAKLYGPLRAALPTPTEQAAGIAVKLFGLTQEGLVVIDVRTTDIDNVPPAALRR